MSYIYKWHQILSYLTGVSCWFLEGFVLSSISTYVVPFEIHYWRKARHYCIFTSRTMVFYIRNTLRCFFFNSKIRQTCLQVTSRLGETAQLKMSARLRDIIMSEIIQGQLSICAAETLHKRFIKVRDWHSPGGGPPYFRCPFIWTNFTAVIWTQDSNEEMLAGFSTFKHKKQHISASLFLKILSIFIIPLGKLY